MVDSKRYNPSNKRFQKHTQSFVEGKTMKGNLNQGKKDKNSYKIDGVLVKVNKNALNEDGWYVQVEKKVIRCTYGDNIIYLPPYTENGDWYMPKSKCEVEVSINEKSNINTITKMKDPKKQPITMNNDGIKLSSGTGTGEVQIIKNEINLVADNITAKSEISAENEITLDTTNHKDLPNQIKITDMYREIQELKEKVSDSNVNGE